MNVLSVFFALLFSLGLCSSNQIGDCESEDCLQEYMEAHPDIYNSIDCEVM